MYHLATGKAPEGFYTAKEIETQLAESSPSIPQQYRWFYELIRINLAGRQRSVFLREGNQA
ncbi:MAG: hypothetical protein U0744_19510 [Gemmataceae bacterium]